MLPFLIIILYGIASLSIGIILGTIIAFSMGG